MTRSPAQRSLGLKDRRISPVEREARRLARPILRAIAKGQLSVDGLNDTNRWAKRARRHAVIECLAKWLASREPSYERVESLGMEKDGILLARGVAFKLGARAEIEPRLYAKASKVRRKYLAESVTLASCVVAMERATPLAYFDPDSKVVEGWESDKRRRKQFNRITADAHDYNVAFANDGRYVLIDYSWDNDE